MKTILELKMVKVDLSDVKTIRVEVNSSSLLLMLEQVYDIDSVSELLLNNYCIAAAKTIYLSFKY